MDRTLNGNPEAIKKNLKGMADKFLDEGFHKWNIILDPGIGFGKKGQQNVDIIENLGIIKELEFPVMVCFSNKRHTRSLFEFKFILFSQ